LRETTRSCGCLKNEVDVTRVGTNNPNYRHGRCIGDFDRRSYGRWWYRQQVQGVSQ
jgi:hypothetical protein